jgi:hypothetical protein
MRLVGESQMGGGEHRRNARRHRQVYRANVLVRREGGHYRFERLCFSSPAIRRRAYFILVTTLIRGTPPAVLAAGGEQLQVWRPHEVWRLFFLVKARK